ncbi:MAG: hypothetical protein D6798_06135 [Deltaproteobacteria bacterium]|nr:MAG: hypothetical protein D6798_06135 [Deltaproteobacteria bacterium]
MSGIFDHPPAAVISEALQARMRKRLAKMSDTEVQAYLADAIYLERRRFHEQRKTDPPDPAEVAPIQHAARAIRGDRRDQELAILHLVDTYAHEIHNEFNRRTYQVATKVLPGALGRLLTATRPGELLHGHFNPEERLVIETAHDDGGAWLRRIAQTHTLIYAPTHVSNLDSPLIGFALHSLGLPPAIYGAGLNLFSSPVMAYFMSRLGAYTVDRRKKHALYKDVLKDYSVDSLGRRCHSLFFPGGTRSRSGRVETSVKKGLLGTGIIAWQEGLEKRRPNPEVLVIPVTLSFSLVLEAETLIEDCLQEEGKRRYIIADDEFSQPRTVAHFARQILNLDDAIVIRFGRPLDLLGHPVDDEGRTIGPGGSPLDRRLYVTDRDGTVDWDEQRDRVYTRVLSESLVRAWHRDNTVLATHAACYAAGQLLRRSYLHLPTAELVLVDDEDRSLPRARLLEALAQLIETLEQMAAEGRLRLRLPGPAGDPHGRATAVLAEALQRFRGFHSRRALADEGTKITMDTRLCLYYGHRLSGYGLPDPM